MREYSAAEISGHKTEDTKRLFSSIVFPDYIIASQKSKSEICKKLSVPPHTWVMR